MTDWLSVLTRQPARPAPEGAPAPGSIGGAIAGEAARRAPQSGHAEVPVINPGPEGVVIGPGGVEEGLPLDAQAEQRLDRLGTMAAIWGQEAGVMARRSSRRPRMRPAEQADFPIGPGGVVGRDLTLDTSRAVGVPETFMRALTGHESGDNPNAEAPTSSAAGLGQFIDSTWLRMMRQYGPAYGFGQGQLANLSNADILELKTDPEWARIMVGEYARENAPILRRAVGRDVTEGEVYLGHWLGPETASVLIKAVDEDRRGSGRGRLGRDVVDRAAFNANMPIFYTPDARITLEGEGNDRRFVYHGGGRLRTVSEVHAAQTRAFRRDLWRAPDPSRD